MVLPAVTIPLCLLSDQELLDLATNAKRSMEVLKEPAREQMREAAGALLEEHEKRVGMEIWS